MFNKFKSDLRGNVTIIFALAIIPLLAAVGAGIDFARYTNVQTGLQAALDAAAMAAANDSNGTTAHRIQIAQATFDQNLKAGEAGSYPATLNITIGATTVSAKASEVMPLSFLVAAGLTSTDVGASNEITIPGNKKAEIAFVLDYSGSMADVAGTKVKYIAMREAATKLIDTLSSANPNNVKFALVPFSHQVYTTLPGDYVLGQAPGSTWTGCTQDRQYPFNLSDATPTSAAGAKWGQPMAPDHIAWGCNGYIQNHLVLKPLSNDFTGLKAQLAAMTPYAWTHVPLGVEFGYHVLSPNAPFTGAANYNDATTQKFMVVLTDGTQTEPAFGPGGIRTVAQGDANLAQLCTNAKASGITIITLAYDLDDSTQRQRLQNCASDPTNDFFVVANNNDLANAFNAITDAITQTAFYSK